MLIFPQLSTGALAQYPIEKTVSQRTIVSVLEDGTRITSPDANARYLSWKLPFEGINTQEVGALSNFFAATQGKLRPFLFLDPTANLLCYSENYAGLAWSSGVLSLSPGQQDPFGGLGAAQLRNPTSSDQKLLQSTQIPGLTVTCFSIYLRANVPCLAVLLRTVGPLSQMTQVAITPAWKRYFLSGSFPASTDNSEYELILGAGISIEVFGAQVDAQANPSPYVRSGETSGVHGATRFDMNDIDFVATGPNRTSCVVLLRSRISAGGEQ